MKVLKVPNERSQYKFHLVKIIFQMKMLSQLGTNKLTDQLLELLEWLFATKILLSNKVKEFHSSPVFIRSNGLILFIKYEVSGV